MRSIYLPSRMVLNIGGGQFNVPSKIMREALVQNNNNDFGFVGEKFRVLVVLVN